MKKIFLFQLSEYSRRKLYADGSIGIISNKFENCKIIFSNYLKNEKIKDIFLRKDEEERFNFKGEYNKVWLLVYENYIEDEEGERVIEFSYHDG